jgi:long-chain acyl-CoA synthetase
MNIVERIKQETARFAAKTAVIDGDLQISYSQLLSSTSIIASDLEQKGVKRLHRVGLICDDGIDYIVTSLAVLSLNAVIVPISPEQTMTEIEHVIDRIDVDFLIFEQGKYQTEDTVNLDSDGLYKKNLFISTREAKRQPESGYYSINPAFIRFSSGTTGDSKGVVLSHEGIIDRTDAADKGLAITPDDSILWVLSMSFHFVVTILLFLRRAATIIVCNKRFPESLIDGVLRRNGTFIYASPFHYSVLARSGQLTGDSLKNIRMAVSTAMKLPDATASEFQSKFGFDLSEAYGIIEVGLPFIKFRHKRDKRGSVGRPLPDYDIELRNVDTSGTGEIWLRGKGMLDAYFSPWKGRDEILQNGWFRTGDMGRIDGDGFLFINGRDKDVINFLGMKIFAQEVEMVLNQHPMVEESLVSGSAHPQYGQIPVARVVLKKDALNDMITDELRKFCYERLAPYKVPKDFEFTAYLPKTASGKLKRPA